MRSEVVVFPASIWAIMPIFLVYLRSLLIFNCCLFPTFQAGSESEVSESLVGLGHTVGILFLFIGSAFVVIGSHHFGSKFLGHAVAGTFACEQNEVFHAQADFPVCLLYT